MFNSGVIAASGVTSGYSATLGVGSAGDKQGTRYGFRSDANSTPAFQQQGSNTATTLVHGSLSDVIVNLGGTDYQIVAFVKFNASQSLTLLHPDQTSSTPLPADLFTSISTDLGTLNASDVTTRQYVAIGTGAHKVTEYYWTTSGDTAFTDIIGVTATNRPLTITE